MQRSFFHESWKSMTESIGEQEATGQPCDRELISLWRQTLCDVKTQSESVKLDTSAAKR